MLTEVKYKDGSIYIFRCSSYSYIHFYKGECKDEHNSMNSNWVCIDKDGVKSIKYIYNRGE